MTVSYRLVTDFPPAVEFIKYEPYVTRGEFLMYTLLYPTDAELANLQKIIRTLSNHLIGLFSTSLKPEMLVFSLEKDILIKEQMPRDFHKLNTLCLNIKTHLFVISDALNPYVVKMGPQNALFRATSDSLTPGQLFGGRSSDLKEPRNRWEWLRSITSKYKMDLNKVVYISDQEEDEELVKGVGCFISKGSQKEKYMCLKDFNATFLSLLLFGRDISSIRGEI